MNDAIEFSFPVELIGHVRSLFSSSSSALSVFSEFPDQAIPGGSADTEALRKAGILDALGHLSPVFQKTLVFLACPEASTSVSIEGKFGHQKFTIFHAAGLSHSVLVNFAENQLDIIDPAHLELATQYFSNHVGSNRSIPIPFDIELPIAQALIFSSVLDLHRKAEVNKILGEQSSVSFSPTEIQNHLLNSSDSTQWIVPGIKSQLSAPFQIVSLEKELIQLVKSGLCVLDNGNFSLKSPALQIAQNLVIATRKISISLARIFRGSQLTNINYLFLQGCYSLFFGFSVINETNVRFSCYNNSQFLEKGAFWLYKGIYELPEPTPSEGFAQETLIVSAPSSTVWKLLPKSSPIPQGTRTTSALAPIPIVGSIRFGRSPDNQIVLSDPSVSRLHAQIELRDGFCWLADLNSSNGTFVNGNKIKNNVKLSNADQIQIGPFTYEVHSEEASTPRKEQAEYQPLITTTEPEMAIKASDKQLLCPRCGQPVTQSMHYCDQCGQSLEG